MKRVRYAVVLTHDRPDDCRDCLAAIAPQVDHVFTVRHLADYHLPDMGTIIDYAEDPPNISRAWNLGLRAADAMANRYPYYVAVLNDDAIVPPDWFERVTQAMQDTGSVAGAVARGEDHRMAGFAFILDGYAKLYADEQFEWWYGDDDIEQRAHAAGGVVQVPGMYVEHRHPNSTTVGVLAEKAAADRVRYERKWNL